MKEQIIKRIKSLLWRAGAFAVVAFLTFIIENIADVGIASQWVVLVSLLLGEVTKFLNNQIHREEV